MFVISLVMVSAIGGFLFGLDTAAVSGAMILIKDDFNPSHFEQELIVSSTVFGAAVFAFLAGRLNTKFGRKPVIMSSALLFMIGSVILTIAGNINHLIIGRTIVGIAIGLASMTVPIFIAEVAPTNIRGRLLTTYNLFVTGGQFISSVINGTFASVDQGWRYMFLCGAIPAGIQLVCFILFVPESPRWLVLHDHRSKALDVLRKIRNGKGFQEEFDEIRTKVKKQEGQGEASMMDFWKKLPLRRALILGCGLQIIQQLSGINVAMYYSGTILQMAGFTDDTVAVWMTAVVAFFNFAFTLVGIYVIERIGRRPLALASLGGSILCLLLLGAAFQAQPPIHISPTTATGCGSYTSCSDCVADSDCGFCSSGNVCLSKLSGSDDPPPLCPKNDDWAVGFCPTSSGIWVLLALLLYLMAFAPGMGPIPWVVNAEIYPLSHRSIGTSLSTTMNWVSNGLVALTFLTLSDNCGSYGSMYLYAVFATIGWLWLSRSMKETKNKSLEEIESLFIEEDDHQEYNSTRNSSIVSSDSDFQSLDNGEFKRPLLINSTTHNLDHDAHLLSTAQNDV
eukprot:TRINITY_DN3574_c0_g1_i1.p1 TRINITY_DN3574_c0_g1~~TRINITY_DN3574_c0_g1_i1.p1  ORF type:complete len:564 (+),score=100.35 TRINITY_DN3574_c0_g1_i1:124-1815(+)